MRQWYACLMFIPLFTACAAEADSRTMLTLDQAIISVLERNPMLKAADYEAKAAAERIRAAQLTPAFRTSLELENFGGSGIHSGSDLLESTLSLSKVLELGGKAGLRGDVARNKALLLRNEQDAQRLDLLVEVTKRFVQVVADQERLALAKHTLKLAKKNNKAVQLRVNAGKSANTELRYVGISLAKTQLELEHARHALATSRLKLATMWGDKTAEFIEAKAALFALDPPATFESLAQQLERSPDLVRFATEQRLARTQIQLARSRRKADIEIAGGLRHFNFTDDTGLVVSLDIPLGNRSRAAPKVDEEEWNSQRQPYDLEQRRLELHATLFEVHQEIQHAIDAVSIYRDTIIPLSASALKDYEKGYNAGRYSLLELFVAQRTLIDAKLEAVMAAADYHRYRSEIDRLTGAGLSFGGHQ
ncbi:MAG: TolC family protein [Gammaproteobacteria bacterium]|nr:TolC family protein [Gammaproteobacteria bacterium]